MEKRFKYSLTVKIITTIVIIVMLFFTYHTIIQRQNFDKVSIISVLVIIILLIPIILAPISVKTDSDGVYLKMLLLKKFYSKELYDIDYIDNVSFSNSLRMFASGGFMGFTGWYWNKKNGFFKLVETSNCHKFIKIKKKTGGKDLYIGYED